MTRHKSTKHMGRRKAIDKVQAANQGKFSLSSDAGFKRKPRWVQPFSEPITTSWSGLKLWYMLAKGPSIERAPKHYVGLGEA